jgi:predicted enzyme related to lactoylglutathione lyase
LRLTARFAHTSLVAQDWQRLAHFYEDVFGCTPVPPERDLTGEPLELATGVRDAHIRGIHLRLPGYGNVGPTLEIFEYSQLVEAAEKAINRPGFAHIAFAVDDVRATRDAVLTAGGGAVGETVSLEVPDLGSITFAYLTDPEGNIVEVQHWDRS